jgi:hypothetical protein
MAANVLSQQYFFVSASTSADNGTTVLCPGDITHPAAGRWLSAANITALELSTKPVVSGTAAVGAVGTGSDAGHRHPPSICIAVSADAAASTTTAETTVHVCTGATTITGAWIHPTGAVTASDTLYATLTLKNGDGAGAARTTIATLVTNVAGGSWVAFTKKDMGAITNGVVPAQGIVTLTIAKASTGTQLPAFMIELVCG